MNKTAYLTIFAAIVLIAGCRSDNSRVEYIAPPELNAFDIVDSYGIDSGLDPFTQLRLSPFMDSGLFEIFWDVYNEDDYTVEISINDIPALAGRRIISTDYCGPGLECDLEGVQYCEYNADFSLSCDPPSENFPGQNVTYFDDLVVTVPQTMYFILDICDTNSDTCEFQILDVEME